MGRNLCREHNNLPGIYGLLLLAAVDFSETSCVPQSETYISFLFLCPVPKEQNCIVHLGCRRSPPYLCYIFFAFSIESFGA